MAGVTPYTEDSWKKSNYDLLMHKTPEELAEWIMSIEPAACPFRDDHGDDCRFTHCRDCWLDWFQRPAKGE